MKSLINIRLFLTNEEIPISKLMYDVNEICGKYSNNITEIMTGWNYKVTFFDSSSLILAILKNEVVKATIGEINEQYSKQEKTIEEEKVLSDINLVNNIVYFEHELEVDEKGNDINELRTRNIISMIYKLAQRWNALVIYNDMTVFSSNGKILLSLKEGNKAILNRYIPNLAPQGTIIDGYTSIMNTISKVYSNDELKDSYIPMIKYRFNGPDPLDEIKIYEKDDYYHFITFGFSDLDVAKEKKEYSKYGFELTFKLKKGPLVNDEEIKSICGILQQLARYVYESGKVFKTYDYIYTKQTDGIDINHKSSIVAFITIEDPLFKTIDTFNGKVQFIELIGVTLNEINQILNKEKTIEQLIEEILSKYSDITSYERN